jgi:4-hydroxybenzoate polyprenyltransferase
MAYEEKEIEIGLNNIAIHRDNDKETNNNNNNRTAGNEEDIKSISRLSKKLQSFVLSQILLLQSRKKWGIIFTIATLVGTVCSLSSDADNNAQIMTIIQSISNYDHFGDNLVSLLGTILKVMLLPIITSFLIIVGMYVFNDLIDADLDKINGKKRPIPMGLVSKWQAWIFVVLTNGLGIIFSIVTFNCNCIIETSMLAIIGILYSAPKIALKDRFIIKTLCISLAMMLCLMIGSSTAVTATSSTTSVHNNYDIHHDLTSIIMKNEKLNGSDHFDFGNPTHINFFSLTIVSIYSALMLGIMVFITSPFNDLGDISGDKAAGRKTIPVVIGKENTVKLAILLAVSLPIISVIAYCLFPTIIGIYSPILVGIASILITITMTKALKSVNEPDIVIKFLKKKTLPLHITLQVSLMAGSILLLFSR